MTGSQPRPEVGSKASPPPPIFMIFSFFSRTANYQFFYSSSFLAVTIWQDFENWSDTVPMRCATEMGNVNDPGIEWADRRRRELPSPLPTQRSGEVNPTTIFTATPTPKRITKTAQPNKQVTHPWGKNKYWTTCFLFFSSEVSQQYISTLFYHKILFLLFSFGEEIRVDLCHVICKC